MYPLLPYELIRLLVQLCAKIAMAVDKLMTMFTSTAGGLPNRNLAQEVIFLFKLLHLSVTDGAIFRVHEVMLDFMPWSDVLTSQCNLDPGKLMCISIARRLYWPKGRTGCVQEQPHERSRPPKRHSHSTFGGKSLERGHVP